MDISEKCFNELVDLVEEIINEVSVGKLAKATENNLLKRQEKAKKSAAASEKAWKDYETRSKAFPEDEPHLYTQGVLADEQAVHDDQKARHAEDLATLHLPKDSKVSANKLFKAAKKVKGDREKKTEETVATGKHKEFARNADRDYHAFSTYFADPVKARHEALEIMETLELWEGLFIKDGRGDLLVDIDTALGSPVQRAVDNFKKNLINNVKKGETKKVK